MRRLELRGYYFQLPHVMIGVEYFRQGNRRVVRFHLLLGMICLNWYDRDRPLPPAEQPPAPDFFASLQAERARLRAGHSSTQDTPSNDPEKSAQ